MMEAIERQQKHLERLDVCVRAVEVKWGVPFMVERYVSPELAAKFQRQWDALSEAIMEQRHEDVCVLADGALRGVWAMDKEASGRESVPALAPIGVAQVAAVTAPVPTDTETCQMPKEFWAGGGDEIPF